MISTQPSSWIQLAVALAAAPLLPGVVARTKAIMAGRKGAPLVQPYRDLARLLGKGTVYSGTTTWVLRLAPVAVVAATVLAAALLPMAGSPAPLSFEGDLVLLVGLLAAGRFAVVLGALDTGSSFEGMGASREAQIGALAEVALYLSLAAAARKASSLSLGAILGGISSDTLAQSGPSIALVAGALLIVFLAENARIPFDDPNTHLELTMIHEVMILDHGGPDLAFLLYGSALKMWVVGMLLVGAALPVQGSPLAVGMAATVAALIALAILTGLIESMMARLRLLRVPQLLAGAAVLAAVALLLALR